MGEDGEPGHRWISGAQRQTGGGSLLREDSTRLCRQLNGLSHKNVTFGRPFLSRRESEATKAHCCLLALSFSNNYGLQAGKAKERERKCKGHTKK